MSEQTWQVTARDGKHIFGLTTFSQVPSNRHVVMVHGLTGHPYEYALKRGADILAEKGYTVHRLALYGDGENNRKLHETTLEIHASDVNDVIAEKCPDAEKLFLIGHSYGGPTIMIANPENVTAVSLWDPSFDLKSMWAEDSVGGTLIEQQEMVFADWNCWYRLNPDMVAEGEKFDESGCLKLSENFHGAIQVVYAGDGLYVKGSHSYHSKGHTLNHSVVVPGTMHCFWEENTCEKLLYHTLDWFEKF